jgi:hypothetical protein
MSLIGAVGVLASYYLITARQMNPLSTGILLLNIAASVLLAVVALLLGNLGYLFLNVVWMLIAVSGFRRGNINV